MHRVMQGKGCESNKSRPGNIVFDSKFAFFRGGKGYSQKPETVVECLFREDFSRKQAVKSD